MAPKKNRKQPQDTTLEEPAEHQVAPPESIGEEEPRLREDRDEPESEEEQRSSVLFTQEQLEVLLKMGRPDFGELVAAFKTGATKGERFQPAKPGNFDCHNPSFGLATKARGCKKPGSQKEGSLGAKAKALEECGPRGSPGVITYSRESKEGRGSVRE
jgi:hypothetical protein